MITFDYLIQDYTYVYKSGRMIVFSNDLNNFINDLKKYDLEDEYYNHLKKKNEAEKTKFKIGQISIFDYNEED